MHELDKSELKVRATSVIQYCENPVVNALISVKAQEAAAQKVLFRGELLIRAGDQKVS